MNCSTLVFVVSVKLSENCPEPGVYPRPIVHKGVVFLQIGLDSRDIIFALIYLCFHGGQTSPKIFTTQYIQELYTL